MTNKNSQFTAVIREKTGRKIKSLRREGILPANIFGKAVESQSIQVDTKNFIKLYREVGETSVIDLNVEGEKKSRPVLVSNIQVHPVTGDVLHVDFHQVDMTKKVTATVPFEFVGESIAIKDLGGVLVTPMSEVDVETLPADIPESIQVNLDLLLEIGDSISIGDLELDSSKVEVLADSEEPIVLVQVKKIIVEEPEESEESDEESDGQSENSEESSESKEEKTEESKEDKK